MLKSRMEAVLAMDEKLDRSLGSETDVLQWEAVMQEIKQLIKMQETNDLKLAEIKILLHGETTKPSNFTYLWVSILHQISATDTLKGTSLTQAIDNACNFMKENTEFSFETLDFAKKWFHCHKNLQLILHNQEEILTTLTRRLLIETKLIFPVDALGQKTPTHVFWIPIASALEACV